MSSPDQDPGGRFDAWSELKFAIRELHSMAVALGTILGADDEQIVQATWSQESWQAVDLLERVYADIGELSGTYLRCFIADRTGRDPLA